MKSSLIPIINVVPPVLPPLSPYHLLPWKIQHFTDRSEIMAYVEASGTWEAVLLVTPQTSGASAETLATYITAIVNEYQNKRVCLNAVAGLLESILENGLTFASERAVKNVLSGLRRVETSMEIASRS